MVIEIISLISNFILGIINAVGYLGVFFLMGLESFNIPLPSEIIMTFSGFLVFAGRFNFVAIVLAGALGNVAGSFLSYKLAEMLLGSGREKSKILRLLISDTNFNLAKNWFEKRGTVSVFLGRLMPVVRTFISLPAGLVKMDLKKFLSLTFLGSFIWSGLLVYVGYILGEAWEMAIVYFRKFDYLVLVLIIGTLVWWFSRHLKRE